MISNERQYRMTRAELKKFEEAQAQQGKRDIGNDVDPRVYVAMGGALESEIDELRRQLQEYEDLREGRSSVVCSTSSRLGFRLALRPTLLLKQRA